VAIAHEAVGHLVDRVGKPSAAGHDPEQDRPCAVHFVPHGLERVVAFVRPVLLAKKGLPPNLGGSDSAPTQKLPDQNSPECVAQECV
jgi:hypothetical protein